MRRVTSAFGVYCGVGDGDGEVASTWGDAATSGDAAASGGATAPGFAMPRDILILCSSSSLRCLCASRSCILRSLSSFPAAIREGSAIRP